MLQAHQLIVRPVEVMGDEGHLLVKRLYGIGLHASPTAVILRGRFSDGPSAASSPALNVSYNRSRYARSEANSPSITPVLTSGSDPRRVITRARTITARYASFCCTRGSRSGRISSAAVARRIIPRRCSVPQSSTYPFGSSNSTSVWKPVCVALIAALLVHPLDAFVGEFEQFDQHLVAGALEI